MLAGVIAHRVQNLQRSSREAEEVPLSRYHLTRRKPLCPMPLQFDTLLPSFPRNRQRKDPFAVSERPSGLLESLESQINSGGRFSGHANIPLYDHAFQ